MKRKAVVEDVRMDDCPSVAPSEVPEASLLEDTGVRETS